MARSPYVVPCYRRIRTTGPARTPRGRAHLREREAKSGAENNGKESQLTKTQFDVLRKDAKRFPDKQVPDSGNGPAHRRVWYESEGNYPGGTGMWPRQLSMAQTVVKHLSLTE